MDTPIRKIRFHIISHHNEITKIYIVNIDRVTK